MKDWAEFDELMNKMGVEVHWAEMSKTPPRDSSSGTKKAQDISAADARRRSRNLSNEVRREQVARSQRGIYPSVSPMGYLNIASDGQKPVVVDEARAPLIAKLFEWVASGEHSVDESSLKARELGLSYRKSGKPVSNSTVYKILRNPFYAGRFVWNGRMYQGRHKPIISMKLWGEVQNVLYESEQKIKNNYIFYASTREELEMMYAFVSRGVDDNGINDIRVRINAAKREIQEIIKLRDELAGR